MLIHQKRETRSYIPNPLLYIWYIYLPGNVTIASGSFSVVSVMLMPSATAAIGTFHYRFAHNFGYKKVLQYDDVSINQSYATKTLTISHGNGFLWDTLTIIFNPQR